MGLLMKLGKFRLHIWRVYSVHEAVNAQFTTANAWKEVKDDHAN